jgi:antitoxin ParD1/3/4
MANVEKISVVLTPELASIMKEAIGFGAYASSSEIKREALRKWHKRRECRAKASEMLGQFWAVGLATGTAMDDP